MEDKEEIEEQSSEEELEEIVERKNQDDGKTDLDWLSSKISKVFGNLLPK